MNSVFNIRYSFKKHFALFFALGCYFFTFSQNSNNLYYSTYVTDDQGTLVLDTKITVRVGIIQDNVNQLRLYEEQFSLQTSNTGLISFVIGKGEVSFGDYDAIDWTKKDFYIETAYDFDAGYVFTKTEIRPLNASPKTINAEFSDRVYEYSVTQRNLLTPYNGQMLFCTNCGNGELQIFDGTSWVDVYGQPAKNTPNLVTGITIQSDNPFFFDADLPNAVVPFIAIIEPQDAFDKSVTWSVNNEAVGTIDENGLFTQSGYGDIIITATANDGSGVVGILDLVFQENRPADSALDGLDILGDKELFIGESKELLAIMSPLDIADTAATWSSSDMSVATITVVNNPPGDPDNPLPTKAVLEGLTEGITTITVTSSENPSIQATVDIMVLELPDENADTEAPVILVDGYDGDLGVNIQRSSTATLPNVSANDNVDGDVPVTTEFDLTFNPNPFDGTQLSAYKAIYRTEDAAGNIAKDTIQLNVVDLIKPTITIEQGYVTNDTIVSDNTMNLQLPNATAIDDDGSSVAVTIEDDGFISTLAGVYKIRYNATDPSGNVALDSVFVNNLDKIPPTINYLLDNGDFDAIVNNSVIEVNVGDIYTFPLVGAIDDDNSTLSVAFNDGGFDFETIGTYNVVYESTDDGGNTASVTVQYQVKDLTPPEILNSSTLMDVVYAVPNGIPQTVQVEAIDNVGVVSYEIAEINFDNNIIPPEILNDPASPESFENFTGVNFGGVVTIDNNGLITISKPNPGGFSSDYKFLITVKDALGQETTVVMNMFYTSEGNLSSVQVKELLDDNWLYAGQPGNQAKTLKEQTLSVLEESQIGDAVLYFRVFDVQPGIEVASIMGIYNNTPDLFNASGEFQEQNLVLNTNFEISPLDGTTELSGKEFSIRTTTNLNATTQSTYQLLILLKDNNGLNTCLPIKITVEPFRTLVPEINTIIPDDGTSNTSFFNLKVEDFLFALNPNPAAVPCPLQFANGIFGSAADLQETLLSTLPIISNDMAKDLIKLRLQSLPKYFWLRKDGNVTRLNLRFTVNAKTVDVEYVIDEDNGGCYWGVILDKFKPSNVNSKLSFLDDSDIKPGVVVTTMPINEQSFECIRIPCMTLEPETGEDARAFVVGTGKYLKNVGGGNASGVFEATGFAAAPWKNSYNDPFSQELTIGMKANFSTAFDQELIDQFQQKSAQAQIAVNALKAAKRAFDEAERKLNIDRGALDRLNLNVIPLRGEVNRLRGILNTNQSAVVNLQFELAQTLLKDEICSSPCIVPCYYPGWCRWGRICYPCPRSCGCSVRSPEICVPNPIQKALAKAIGDGPLRQARQALANAQNTFNNAQNRLNQAESPRQALNAAFQSSLDAFNAAASALAAAQSAVDAIGDNDLVELATYLIDHGANQTVATSKAVFVTTLDSANNGTFTGSLTLDVQLLNLPKFTVSFNNVTLTGDQLINVASNVADELIDRIIP